MHSQLFWCNKFLAFSYYYAQQEFIGCLPAEAAEGWFGSVNSPMNPHVRLLVGWLIGRMVIG